MKGFRDLVDEAPLFLKIINLLQNEAEKFNCQPLFPSVLENKEYFIRGLGETSDISKEMFMLHSYETKVLRPEFTTSVVRTAVEHNIFKGRFFSYGPCYRAERPQYNRYREFYQFSVEFLGESSVDSDCECLALVSKILESLKINVPIRINTIGLLEERKNFIQVFSKFLEKNRKNLSYLSQQRLDKGDYFRILDSKDTADRITCNQAPKLQEFLGEESKQRFLSLKNFLQTNNISFKEENTLVRGLDYYKDSVFEVKGEDLCRNNQISIMGGGRYDHLAKNLFSRKINAIGFAFGIDRLMNILNLDNNFKIEKRKKIAAIDLIDIKNNKLAQEILYNLRENYAVQLLEEKTLINGLNEANKRKYDYVLIFGEEFPQITIKNLHTREQKTGTIDLINSINF